MKMRLLQAGLAGVVFVMGAATGWAQYFPGAAHCGHRPCANPCYSCGHVQCTCTTLRPVVETSYRPEQYVAERQVTQLECQAEPFAETVPVTSYKTVTVDEGKYEMVWVPKMVTRSVPETRYEQRTGYRMVPRQVTRSVPELRTRLVPQQTVRYVPEQTHMTVAVPYAAPVTATAPWPVSPQLSYSAPAVTAAPVAPWSPTSSAAIPEMPAIDVPTQTARSSNSNTSSAASLGPTPDPRFLETPTLTAPGLSSESVGSADRLGDWQRVPSRADIGHRPVEAPSAATVWNAQRTFR